MHKLSFKPFSPEEYDGFISNLSDFEPSELHGVFDTLCEQHSYGIESAISSFSGCVLVRLFDGEYKFPYPIAMTEYADELEAVMALRDYAVKEEIPLIICDIPTDAVDAISHLFKSPSFYAEDADGEFLTMHAQTPIAHLGRFKKKREGKISLGALRRTDAAAYYRLLTDKETNRFWGYDFTDDYPCATPAELIAIAKGEIKNTTALPLAIRLGGRFIGEAILYAFDLSGGCECALRIKAEKRGHGYGTIALSLLVKTAKELGIENLYATVNENNESSVKLFKKAFTYCTKDGENLKFVLDLTI